MSKRITIDPITRIEGHLRIDVDVDGGRVKKAWSSGQMWRGVELILLGRDPRDAWAITQRICGVCTTVHAITSVRAVENALKMEIPLNAQYIRNLIILAHSVHDFIVHFYHLSALDWVDVTSALKADPDKTAILGESLSSWHLNSKHEMRRVHARLKHFVNGGQLGIFTNGYWGHPAMKLSPEVNLLAVAHYLQALEVQRKANKIVSILGAKTPHIQNVAVGGVANPLATDSQAVLTVERLMAIKGFIDELDDFVKNVYLIDVAAVGAFYADWTKVGRGITNYLSVPDIPLDTKGTQFGFPGGFVEAGNLGGQKQIKTFNDEYWIKGVEESVKHSWYNYDKAGPLHPYKGQTVPNYTDFKDDAKYSWLKSPTFYGKVAQVGPLARVINGLAAGHAPTTKYATAALDTVSALAKTKVGLDAMHSTIGRHAARAISCCVNMDMLAGQWSSLLGNMAKGDLTTFNKPVFPKDEVMGMGFHEAPRGALSHWVVIDNGKIKNYQCVVPSTWNACPRNDKDEPGPYESSLVDTPIADAEKPLEVLRTIHSFDPCIACAIHLTDKDSDTAITVKAV
ncbi:nickel-dependent hydrogenase large subunit [Sulfuritalea hydrogenivorans]|jgi:hydrogenase large subunit|uniref:hydrogenase (acceptor) n=1 Tax=Sulfuritalea hydrogenivorans sk43H TaxID=1223802 RepID=W0SFX5_9PROT|nr:nickel-dependent hydrogenase large subunit [Sulfuritalea hydrogenivorans]MDK9712527.1 nickel-dependent hydrogenase large subunit [Sulfuritalea sp.]BAO29822.1 nickel-dependent hydrogenase large subunit [Sulfuritalea hydrogenivorans sk43H]